MEANIMSPKERVADNLVKVYRLKCDIRRSLIALDKLSINLESEEILVHTDKLRELSDKLQAETQLLVCNTRDILAEGEYNENFKIV